jgi:carbon storage regulator
MLQISRRVGEKLRIGEDVVIEVLEVSASGVRLGVDAPRSVSIYREELWIAIREENVQAAETTDTDG